MKKIIVSFVLMLLVHRLYAQPFTNPNSILDTFKKSIPCIAKGMAGGVAVEINYYSPGVKKRVIWGGLVPFEQVWVTGAHNATRIQLNKDVKIGGTLIKAGTYAIFTIPGPEQWIFILNRNYQQHLTDKYNEQEDILRLMITPATTEQSLERLEYSIQKDKLVIAWEKIRLEIPVEAK
ncbi:MAG: DUF2911 domain-containing protein [Lacibacter sp.]|jgi:hypothetical protein